MNWRTIKTIILKSLFTIILTALAVGCQFMLRDFPFIYATVVINALIFTNIICIGPIYALLPATVTPVSMYMITHLTNNVITTAPVVLLIIGISNITFIIITSVSRKLLLTFEYVKDDKGLLNKIKLNCFSGFFSSLAKAVVMSVFIVLIILPIYKDSFDNLMVVDKARMNYSIMQLVAAIISVVVVGTLVPSIVWLYEFVTVPVEDDEFQNDTTIENMDVASSESDTNEHSNTNESIDIK